MEGMGIEAMTMEDIPKNRPLLVYDGECGICNHSVQFVLSHEKRHDLLFVNRNSDLGMRLRRRFGLENVESMLWIENGSAKIESEAVLQVARYISGWCRIALIAHCIPSGIRNWAYRVFAKNRRRIGGAKRKCILPTPDQRPRFVG